MLGSIKEDRKVRVREKEITNEETRFSKNLNSFNGVASAQQYASTTIDSHFDLPLQYYRNIYSLH